MFLKFCVLENHSFNTQLESICCVSHTPDLEKLCDLQDMILAFKVLSVSESLKNDEFVSHHICLYSTKKKSCKNFEEDMITDNRISWS